VIIAIGALVSSNTIQRILKLSWNATRLEIWLTWDIDGIEDYFFYLNYVGHDHHNHRYHAQFFTFDVLITNLQLLSNTLRGKIVLSNNHHKIIEPFENLMIL